jgi:hypothetical protein
MLAGAERGGHVAQMVSKDKEREERLAAALRENLRKRKAQARTSPGAKPNDGADGSQ